MAASCLGFEEKLEAHLRNFSCGANNATGSFSLFNQCQALCTFRVAQDVSIVNCEGGLGLPWPPLEFVRTAQKNGNFILLLMKLYTDTMQGTSQDKPFLLSQDWLYVSPQVLSAFSTRGRDGLWQFFFRIFYNIPWPFGSLQFVWWIVVNQSFWI